MAKSTKSAKRRPAATRRAPAAKSIGTKIVETAQAAVSWVADTAKDLVDKGTSLIKPSESSESHGGASTESTGTAHAAVASPSGGVNGHDEEESSNNHDEDSNEMGEAPQPMKDDDDVDDEDDDIEHR